MKLKNFLETKTDADWADLLGVAPTTVASWRYGRRFPRFAVAKKIVTESGGDLTLDDVYSPCPRVRRQYRRRDEVSEK